MIIQVSLLVVKNCGEALEFDEMHVLDFLPFGTKFIAMLVTPAARTKFMVEFGECFKFLFGELLKRF